MVFLLLLVLVAFDFVFVFGVVMIVVKATPNCSGYFLVMLLMLFFHLCYDVSVFVGYAESYPYTKALLEYKTLFVCLH